MIDQQCVKEKVRNDIAEILVVEDDPEINELLGAYIELSGYECKRVKNGADAIAHAISGNPSLVLLDVMLPDMSGVDICARLRKIPSTAQVPIIMLTACDLQNIRDAAHKAGATELRSKPFDPERLMETIEMRLNGVSH